MFYDRQQAGPERHVPASASSPDLELVDISRNESFKVWSHGYPYRTVRWHYHPEYELHLVVETSGRFFVGDHVGRFEPGHLVLAGPNLPHNWVSEIDPNTEVALRCIVVQFSQTFILAAIKQFPELHALARLLQDASCGLSFDAATSIAAKPILLKLLQAQGVRRLVLFLDLLNLLQHCPDPRRLASLGYIPDPKLYAAHPLNQALEHISANLAEELRESEVAEIASLSRTAFSRAFKRHTGVNFIRYINEMRIRQACELLLSSDERVVEICFQVGFNNLSNFNRHFLAFKKVPPSVWRDCKRRELLAAETAAALSGPVGSTGATLPIVTCSAGAPPEARAPW